MRCETHVRATRTRAAQCRLDRPFGTLIATVKRRYKNGPGGTVSVAISYDGTEFFLMPTVCTCMLYTDAHIAVTPLPKYLGRTLSTLLRSWLWIIQRCSTLTKVGYLFSNSPPAAILKSPWLELRGVLHLLWYTCKLLFRVKLLVRTYR